VVLQGQQEKTGLFQHFFQVFPPGHCRSDFSKPRLQFGFRGVEPVPDGLHWGWHFSGLFSVRFLNTIYFQQHGPLCFPVCFFHRNVFSITSPLCFSVCSALFFGNFRLESVTSPVRF
jgi:hypothetical protein